MTSLAYISFVVAAAVIGGIVAHYWRAHATMFAEDLGLGEALNTLTRDDYQFEKYVVGAEWDDAGFWASGSVRNLLYYMASGFAAPLVLGVVLWGQRTEIVRAVCAVTAGAGFDSPLCP